MYAEIIPTSGDCATINGFRSPEEDCETEAIVQQFIQLKLRQSGTTLQRTSYTCDPQTQILVYRLIDISNELEARYGEQLNRDAELWIQSATFDKFVQIADGLFSDGVINWSRIVVLFMFSVKVVYNALSRSLNSLVGDVVRFAVQFIFFHGIHKWVQARGGWLALLRDYSAGSNRNGLVVFTGILVIVLAFLLRKT